MNFNRRVVIAIVLAVVSLSSESLALDRTTYRTRDGRSWIRPVSSDELEYRHEGTTLLCKYSVQDGSLRVILTVLGTQQVLYFKRTPDGYTSEDGESYMTPAAIADLQRREQAAREAQQRAQQAEAARRAEAERVAREAERVAREAAQREAERAREAAARKAKADIDMLEGTDCSTESLSISVPANETRKFRVDSKRHCWTPWLIGTQYLTWERTLGDILVQAEFESGKTKEQIAGPTKTFDLRGSDPVKRIRFKSVQEAPVEVLFKAHY